jgi:putative transposase
MSRPLRIEFPGAIYQVTSRGDQREPIFEDDVDREAQLRLVLLVAQTRWVTGAVALPTPVASLLRGSGM